MKKARFSVRPCVKDDIEQIVNIQNEVGAGSWSPAAFAAELDGKLSFFWVLTDNETDAIVGGYLVFRCLQNHAHVLNFGVAADEQRKGYGKLLIRKLVDHCLNRRINTVHLEVRKSNEQAILFYQSCGFETVSIRENEYSDGESAYLMELVLSE